MSENHTGHLQPNEVAEVPEPRESESQTGFAALGLRPELLATLAELEYSDPTPIQNETIPHLLSGADLLGQAATGTGKTAAFMLPVINGIDAEPAASPVALVLVPTRELAVQVTEAARTYGKAQRIRVVAIYGGQPIHGQIKDLRRGVHVVVATPGRAIDHIKRRSLSLDNIRTVVLDEADEMLDMGFTEDIETILESTPTDRQTVLFSATMPSRINNIAKRHQNDPVRIQISHADSMASQALVRQSVYGVHRANKAAALGRILDIESPQSALVFCRTRQEVDDLTETMNGRGYRAEALHGGMDQKQRDRVMARLRDGTANLLVATDVAARGLDVDTLTHVVNYDVPSAPESYVHRIGRVGRAGREGVAITLAEPRQRHLLGNIERLTKQKLRPGAVPSADALKAKQVERIAAAVTEALASPDLEDYNGVLHALAGQDSDRNIVLAAIKLAYDASETNTDMRDIPDISDEFRPGGRSGKGQGGKHKSGKHRGGGRREGGPQGGKFANRNDSRSTSGGSNSRGQGSRGGQPVPGTGKVFINLGESAGIRPSDLVGAIANETKLSGRDIGPIRIGDHYSVVGVPDASVDAVVKALKATTVKGKKAKARRFVE